MGATNGKYLQMGRLSTEYKIVTRLRPSASFYFLCQVCKKQV